MARECNNIRRVKIIGIGPYVGDFKQELLTFRPYVKWLSEVLEYDDLYLNTHMNRRFLYDFVPDENVIPVYETFSRNELGQNGYMHGDLIKKDFMLLVGKFKEKIIELAGCSKGEIEMYYLNYSKNLSNYPHHNKVFNKIVSPNDVRVPKEHKNKIVFIPDRSDNVDRLGLLLKYLQDIYGDELIVVGNMESWFSSDNVILKFPDYFANGWKYILNYILASKCVICPLSYWTSLCNLQEIPVFSWGESPSQHREDGLMNFGNDKCVVIPSDSDTDVSVLINAINYFIKGV